jgi:hypothetical protein
LFSYFDISNDDIDNDDIIEAKSPVRKSKRDKKPTKRQSFIYDYDKNLFHQVRNEGTFFTTLKFISPGNLQEQISHQWNLYNIIFL